MNIRKLILKEVKTDDIGKRECIAKNKYTPEIILESYLSDKEFSVILSIASNPNLSENIINKLIESGDTEIYENLLKNRMIKLNTKNMIDILNNSNTFMDNCSKELFKRNDLTLDVIEHYYSRYNTLDDILSLKTDIPGIDGFYDKIGKKELKYLNTNSEIKLNNLSELELYYYCFNHKLSDSDFRYVYEIGNEKINEKIILNHNSIGIANFLFKENKEDINLVLASQYDLNSEIFKTLSSDEKYIQELCSNLNLSQNLKNKILDLNDIGLTRLLLRNESFNIDLNILNKYLKNYIDDLLKNKTLLNSDNINFVYDYLKENSIKNDEYINTILLHSKDISIIKDILIDNKDLMYIGLLNEAFQSKFEIDEIEVQDFEIPKRYYSGIVEAEPFTIDEDDAIINPYKKNKQEIESLRSEIENSDLNNR